MQRAGRRAAARAQSDPEDCSCRATRTASLLPPPCRGEGEDKVDDGVDGVDAGDEDDGDVGVM